MFKKILIICSIFTIFCSTYSFGTNSVFVENSLVESYDSRVDSFSKRFELSILQNETTRNNMPNFIYNIGSYPYCYVSNNENIVYFYNIGGYNNGTDSTYTTYEGNTVPSREITTSYYISINPRGYAFKVYTSSTTFNMPVSLAQRSYFDVFGNGLYLYYREFSSSSASLSDVKESIDEQTELMQQQNEFLQNTTFNDSDVSISSDTTTDITSTISDNIFTTLMNSFLSESTQNVSFSLFDKQITLNSNITSTLLTTINATFLINVINSFWYFVFAYFIYRDINNYIEKIKSADILTSNTDTNIKANML